MGTDFQFGKWKRFWRKMVATAAQQREGTSCTELYTPKRLKRSVLCSVYVTTIKDRGEEGKEGGWEEGRESGTFPAQAQALGQRWGRTDLALPHHVTLGKSCQCQQPPFPAL